MLARVRSFLQSDAFGAPVAGALLLIVMLAVLLAVPLALGGCAMAKPVSVSVEDGTLEVDNLGRVYGKKVRYRSGVLEAGEAAVTFEGEASGFPAQGPGPAPPPTPPDGP